MNGDKKKKKDNGGLAVVIIALVIGMNIMTKMGARGILIIVPLMMFIVVAVIFVSVFKSLKKTAENQGQAAAENSPRRREPLEDRPSFFRRESLEDKPVSRGQRELLPMDEYERRKRIEQLDGFLKNGIIDRAEYKKLRARYEK